MKRSKSAGLALASLMTLSSLAGVFIGIEPARADDDWFEEVEENCERVSAGYFCRDSDRYGRQSRRGRGPFERSRRGDIYDRRGDIYSRGSIYSRNAEGKIYEGAVIETRTYDNDRIELRRGESRSLTLLVDEDIRSDTNNYILIPRGSRIFGKLKPHDGGVRYEADDIILSNGRRYDLDARSETIYSGSSRSRGRVSSSAATVILGTILGRDRNGRVGDVIRDGDVFARSRRSRGDDYIYINPKSDLDLRLTDDFKVKS